MVIKQEEIRTPSLSQMNRYPFVFRENDNYVVKARHIEMRIKPGEATIVWSDYGQVPRFRAFSSED